MTRYKSAVQKRNAAVLLRKPGRLASQYASHTDIIYVIPCTICKMMLYGYPEIMCYL